MIRQLQIEDFGLIEHADVEFAPGATIFTGETGSGKTMLLGALDFALGARAGGDVVRRGARKAQVTLTFDADEALRERLAAGGFEIDRGEDGTIAREMSEGGRSALRLNGRTATAAQVRELRDAVAEIVGQHEAQRLLEPAYHLELLDRFAGEEALRLRQRVTSAYARANELAAELARLQQDERLAQERYDDAAFAIREIEEARLEPDEPERLRERREYLDNVERIAAALHAAREALAADERGATTALGNAAAVLSGVAKFDSSLRDLALRASAVQSEAVDLSSELSRALDGAEYDPAELEAINARLDLIDRLTRKYGGTVEHIVAAVSRARAIVEEYDGRDRRVAELQENASAAQRDLGETAAALTAARRRAATALSKRVRGEFAELALASGRFDVNIEPLERIGPSGGERIEFIFAANPGEPARPL